MPKADVSAKRTGGLSLRDAPRGRLEAEGCSRPRRVLHFPWPVPVKLGESALPFRSESHSLVGADALGPFKAERTLSSLKRAV
jgi:hypothetical protein